MSNRIVSNSTFAVNSSLEQVVEISNTSAIPVSEEADITKWGGVATSLGQKVASASVPVVLASDDTINVDLDLVGGSSIALGQTTMAASIPVALASDQTALDSNIAEVNGTAISLGQTTSAASFPVVVASDQSAIPVTSSSANNSGAAGNLNNADSVVSGDFSNEIDTRKARNITITGSTTDTSSNAIEIYTAHSSLGTKYKLNFDIYPDASGNFYEDLSGVALNYLYIKYTNTTSATVTASAIFN
jgi:hypothetical protein